MTETARIRGHGVEGRDAALGLRVGVVREGAPPSSLAEEAGESEWLTIAESTSVMVPTTNTQTPTMMPAVTSARRMSVLLSIVGWAIGAAIT